MSDLIARIDELLTGWVPAIDGGDDWKHVLHDCEREIRILRIDKRELEQLFTAIREAAKQRNPDGATLLDFMACWNEQYEARNKTLENALKLVLMYGSKGELDEPRFGYEAGTSVSGIIENLLLKQPPAPKDAR